MYVENIINSLSRTVGLKDNVSAGIYDISVFVVYVIAQHRILIYNNYIIIVKNILMTMLLGSLYLMTKCLWATRLTIWRRFRRPLLTTVSPPALNLRPRIKTTTSLIWYDYILFIFIFFTFLCSASAITCQSGT